MEQFNLRLSVDQFLDLDLDDAYIEVKDLKRGDVIFECEKGENLYLQAVTDAQPIGSGWVCMVQDFKGHQHEIYVSGGTKSLYTPMLYKVPQYLDNDATGKFYYDVA